MPAVDLLARDRAPRNPNAVACESVRFLTAVISVYDQAQKRVADRGTLDGEAAKQALWRFDRYERRVVARFCQQTPALGLFGILHGRGLLSAARVHPVSPSVRAETAALPRYRSSLTRSLASSA